MNIKSHDCIYELSLDIDLSKLSDEFSLSELKIYNIKTDSTAGFSSTWIDEKMNIRARKTSEYLDSESLKLFPETLRIKNKLESILLSDVNAIFTLQRKNFDLPAHTDPIGIKAAINIILPGNTATVSFLNYGDFSYNFAVLNVQLPHYVKKTATDRCMVKYCVTDISYDQCVERIKKWQQSYG